MIGTYKQNFLVGGIFFVSMTLVSIFTVVIKDLSMLKGHQGQMSVVFNKVSGLEPGHKVLASGMEVGQVRELELREDGKVRVLINLTKPVKIYNQYEISVKDASALGGKYVNIELGKQDEGVIPLSAEMAPLTGGAQPSILDDPNLRDAFGSIKNIASDIEKGKGTVGLLITRREIYDDIAKTASNLRDITDQIRNNQGTIGKLLYNHELYDKVDQIASDIQEITSTIRSGKGTVGKLVKDDALYENAKKTIAEANKVMANLNEITQNVKAGKGTVGKLFTDDKVYQQLDLALADARTMLQNINKVAQQINEGQGVVSRLLNDQQMAQDLKDTLSNIRVVTDKLKNGEGTIGKLMADDTLYNEIRRAVKSFSDSLEDTREQVPISTFTGLLFKAF